MVAIQIVSGVLGNAFDLSCRPERQPVRTIVAMCMRLHGVKHRDFGATLVRAHEFEVLKLGPVLCQQPYSTQAHIQVLETLLDYTNYFRRWIPTLGVACQVWPTCVFTRA